MAIKIHRNLVQIIYAYMGITNWNKLSRINRNSRYILQSYLYLISLNKDDIRQFCSYQMKMMSIYPFDIRQKVMAKMGWEIDPREETLLQCLKNPRLDMAFGRNSLLRWACKYCFPQLAKTLLAIPWRGIDVGKKYNCALRKAAGNGHIEIVKILVANSRVNPGDKKEGALRMASANGHTDIVRLLLTDSRVIYPWELNNQALRYASANGHSEIVKLLLAQSRNVNPADENNYAIRFASANGHTEVVKLLLADTRTSTHAGGNGAIRLAAKNGHLEVVRLLLTDPRVNPNEDNGFYCVGEERPLTVYYNNAIQYAFKNRHFEIMRLLLTDSRVIQHLLLYGVINYY